MDYVWSPWRYRYVSTGAPPQGCLFCAKGSPEGSAGPEQAGREQADRENYVVLRAEHNFILLNLFPYTSGHLMIAPYAHVATLEQADAATLH